jgi:transposase
VFAWRKLFGDGKLAPSETACALLPVTLAAPPLAQHVAEAMRASPGVIKLTVGEARLRLEGTVDTAVPNLVLQRLLP